MDIILILLQTTLLIMSICIVFRESINGFIKAFRGYRKKAHNTQNYIPSKLNSVK